MKKNTLEDYKEAIKTKYSEEKKGDYGSLLLNPSRAKLRDLCLIIFNEGRNSEDLTIFRNFFGFDFQEENIRELKKHTDKFRPLETFFKGETDLMDISGVDLAAVLVNYNPRPIQRFLKATDIVATNNVEPATIVDENVDFSAQNAAESETNTAALTIQRPIKATISPKIIIAQLHHKTISVMQIFKTLLLIVAVLISTYGVKKALVPEKQCMLWQKDHYETVDCSSTLQSFGATTEVKPINEEELKLKRIEVSPKTLFYQNNKALIWYSKNNDKLEYFNAAGFHPENGKPLRPITQYMINKYIKK